MKKYTLALALFALMPFVSVSAYEYNRSESAYYTTRPMVKTNTYKRASTTRKTGGYNNIITNNFYYNQPTAQKQYRRASVADTRNSDYYVKTETKQSYKSYTSKGRKFFLAHPFFQPLKGKFGSVTDFSYAHSNFDFDVINGTVLGLDRTVPTEYNKILDIGFAGISGKAETSQFAIKEDLSYGLTDTLALLLMAQYDHTKTEFKDWSSGDGGTSRSDSGLNLFGIGLQNRFIDNVDWILMGEALFEHQRDAANTFIIGIKGGYKINKTTLYGIGRIAYTSLTKGDTYGAFVDDSTGDYLMLSYHSGVDSIFNVEGGFGAFGVLNKYFTLNGELMLGHYDWHEQLNVKGAVSWQPSDMFALNLYASMALYDSAKGKTEKYMNYDHNPDGYATTLVYTTGDYKIKDYNEWKIGIQAIFYF